MILVPSSNISQGGSSCTSHERGLSLEKALNFVDLWPYSLENSVESAPGGVGKWICQSSKWSEIYGSPTGKQNLGSGCLNVLSSRVLASNIVCHLLCGLREEEPQTAHLMSITWASHIAASVLTGCYPINQLSVDYKCLIRLNNYYMIFLPQYSITSIIHHL